jgi:hypothetical protein
MGNSVDSKTSSWVANSEKTLSKLNACLVALVDKPFTTVISPFSVFAVTTGIVFPRFSRLFSGRKRTHTLTAELDDDMLNLRLSSTNEIYGREGRLAYFVYSSSYSAYSVGEFTSSILLSALSHGHEEDATLANPSL